METVDKILYDPDYVHAPRHEFSLKVFMRNREDPPSRSQAAKLLMMTEDELESLVETAIQKLRAHF